MPLFKMAVRHSAEVLSSAPRREKAVKCLMEKLCLLEELRSGVSDGAIVHEFNVNESTINIK